MKALRKALAFLRRDLATDLSYKVSFALEGVDILIGIAAFFFFSRLIGEANPQGYDPFEFILVGIAVNGAMSTSLACFADGIQSDQSQGTLKTILVTPTSPQAVIVLSSLYPLARSSLDAFVYIIGGTLFGVSFTVANLAGAALVFLLALLAFASLGVASAAVTLILKRGDPVLWLSGGLSWLLGGVFFPIDMLPDALRQVSLLLPITHALEALRATLLAGAGLSDVAPHVLVLAGFALVDLPLTMTLFGAAVRGAKRSGTLGHY
ncbi:MAG: ABC transporter permease [Vicinamibacterales bacterium]|jgi:ABC-2 type transport system permease protein|nr:ABC transporter permease [Vicinamibacterales bacterium]MDP7472312.1 ABC transporter permease [Vicinamibacterales bacterium]HJN45658.1 ABC transporter permease [Vicinamibacterales bacterium]